MIPLAIPNLCGNEAKYLQECVTSTFVSSVGPFVGRFEAMVAEASGAGHAVATSAGTTGLHAALTALGVGRDDLVILPSFTFIASANAIAQCGADPWLFDVSPRCWTLDADLLAETLKKEAEQRNGALVHRSSGRRIAAIMPVHTIGLPADMPRIVAVAREFGIKVIADAAAALGATIDGRPVGQFGADCSVFSFNGNKTVTAGGGGAVVSDDEELCNLVRHLTTTARVGADYDHDRVGFNYRMTNIQAAVGCAQMEKLDDFVAAKRRIAAQYGAELATIPGAEFFPEPPGRHSTCWLSGICLQDTKLSARELIDALIESGIGARKFWKPIHLQQPYAHSPTTTTAVSEAIWEKIVTLPCSTHLSESDQGAVIDAVKHALN